MRGAVTALWLWPALAAAQPLDAGFPGEGVPKLEVEEWTAPPESPDAGPAVAPASPIESFAPPSTAPAVRLFGELASRAGLDTRFDSAPGDLLAENVAELRLRSNLGADVRLSERWRVLLEARARWRGSTQRDWERTKATFEPSLGEAYVDYYDPRVDVRFGNQLVAFGANAAFAPADAMNPRDLREGLLTGELEDTKLPAPALRLRGKVGRLDWTAVYFPFFQPNRYDVFGQDEALVQPGLGAFVPPRIDPSIEDGLQQHVLESERPKAWPWLGDLGLRVTTDASGAKVGASWVWMTEKLPLTTLDPEVSSLVAAQARGQPLDPAQLSSVQNRLAAGEQLFMGKYQRQHVLSAEASRLFGPVQVDLDLAWTSAQGFVDDRGDSVSRSVLTAVLGVSQAEDSPWVYAFTYCLMAVPDLAADQQLLLVEPATARGAARTAFVHLVAGSVSYRTWSDQLSLEVRGVLELVQRSWALAPRIAWLGVDGLKVWLGAELFQGPTYSPLGYYRRNDQLLLGASWSFF